MPLDSSLWTFGMDVGPSPLTEPTPSLPYVKQLTYVMTSSLGSSSMVHPGSFHHIHAKYCMMISLYNHTLYLTPFSHICFNDSLFHFDEDILESMTTLEYPWDDMHHSSYLIPHKTFESSLIIGHVWLIPKISSLPTMLIGLAIPSLPQMP